MVRAFCAVVGALLAVGQATAFSGSPSAFMTGTMSAGLRTPGATAALGREARTYRRLSTAKSGAASTVMMPIGVPKVRVLAVKVGSCCVVYVCVMGKLFNVPVAVRLGNDSGM